MSRDRSAACTVSGTSSFMAARRGPPPWRPPSERLGPWSGQPWTGSLMGMPSLEQLHWIWPLVRNSPCGWRTTGTAGTFTIYCTWPAHPTAAAGHNRARPSWAASFSADLFYYRLPSEPW